MNGFLLALTASTLVLGQEAGGSADPHVRRVSATKTVAIEYDGRAGELAVPSPWRADTSIRIDGTIGDREWADAPILSGFTQSNPVEGIPASQRTEVRMLVTDDAVYLGVNAFDDDVSGIRAALGERDSFSRRDDYIRFVLDTFDDQRRGYVIMVNPLGVQADGLWLEGGGGGRGNFGPPIDWNPDFIWESAGKIYDWGYATEIKIPLKSLRFPETDLQDWGFQVDRKIQRNGYEASWAPVSGNVSNKLSQFGSITGLKELDAGLFFEINPVQTLTKQGSFSPQTQAFERGAVTGEFGLNLTYGITSNLTLDGTYNPDFSQVEADAGQIAVNERFSLFFREKRSFFLEGTEIFKLPKQLVYTRSIANPVGGTKLTGKIGSFNVGYLGAVDEVSDASVLDGKRNPVVNLLRVRRDMGASSNVGMVYTDRTSASDIYNRVLGLDGRFVFNQRNTITLLGAGSRTALDGGVQASTGAMFSARFDRTGRNFGFNVELEDVDPDFKAGSGFIRRLGETQVQANTNYNFRGKPGDLIERWGPRLSFKGYWDHDEFWGAGGMRETVLDLNTSVSFRGNVTLWGTLRRAYFNFPTSTYSGLEVALPGGGGAPFAPDQSLFQGLSTASLFVMVNTWDRVNISGRVQVGETPLFDFRTGTPADVAKQLSGNMDLRFFPTPNFATELGLRYSRLKRSLDNSLYSEAVIPRVKAQYQFSRALFFRTIFEYGSSERGGLMDPVTGEVISFCRDGSCSAIGGRNSNDFSIETLLSYEPTPGTVFFLGYGREMEDTGAFRFNQVRAQADGLFVKISYRFRM